MSVSDAKLPYPFSLEGTIWLPDHLDWLQHLDLHRHNPIGNHLDLPRGYHRQVNDPAFDKRATIIDPNQHTLAVLEVGDPNHRVERQLLMRRRTVQGVVSLTIGGESPDIPPPVEGRLPDFNRDRLVLVQGETVGGFHRTAARHQECQNARQWKK